MQTLLQPLIDAGARPAHLGRVVRVWLRGGRLGSDAPHAGLRFPARLAPLLERLEHELDGVAEIASEHPAEDGAIRRLLRLAQGGSIESVQLPGASLCVSTQVGCAVGCRFCMTGRGGLERQLTATEILAQVAQARRAKPVRRVVLMGMGEPGHNLDAVCEAIEKLGTAGGIGHKEIVFSTVGSPAWFERLASGTVKPALALSLHTTDRALRERLLPRAPRHAPAELLTAALDYARRTSHPLQLQWTLLAGVNDGDEELDRLIELLDGERVVVNLIPYNPVDGAGFARSSVARAYAMTRRLHAHRIHAKLRRSAAPDVEGACGQLRHRLV